MKEDHYIKFGKLVKKLRSEFEMTQEELAYASKISVTYISKIENGQTNVSLDTICKLAKGFKIKVSELTEGL